MQDSAQQHRRRWSYTSRATCGLVKPPSDAPEHKEASISSPARPMQAQQQNTAAPSDPTQPRTLPDLPTATTKMSTTILRRKPSLRERFWSVGAANSAVDRDRELKRSAYVPSNAASGFAKTTSSRGELHYIAATSSRRRHSPEDAEYQAFVLREEARDVADQLYGERHTESRLVGVKRRPSNVVRKIAEYVKPPREER